jgi:peptide/nickel transport system substrate-binding protein
VPTAKPVATAVPAAETTVKPTGVLNIGNKESLGRFTAHPSLTGGGAVLYVGVTLGESLIAVDADFNFVPKLAKEWSISPDGLIWTFKLNEGVPFHQGWGEVTAADVLWSIEECALTEGTTCVRAPQFKRLWFNDKGGTTIIDDYTLEVNTGELQYDMLVNMGVPYAGLVYSKKQVDELGDEEAALQGAGTGPFEYLESRTTEFWKLKAVEDHWRKTPNFEEVVYWEIPEESTRVANFQVGKLDTFVMTLDSKTTVEQVPGTKFMRVAGGGSEHLGLMGNWYVGHGTPEHKENRPGYDPDLPWVSSSPDINSPEWERARKVREALFIAVDRQLIADTILGGQGEPLVMWGWESNVDKLDPVLKKGWEFNPDRAKQLLEEAGYADGFEITIVASIRDTPGEVEACEAVASMWRDIGIDAKPQRINFPSFVPSVRSRTYNQANCHGTGGFFDPLSLHAIVDLSRGGWTVGFDHPILDEMIDKAIHTVDDEERFKIMNEYTRWMFDQAADSGLYSVDILWPLGPKLDPWPENLEKGDRRVLSGLEYAPHRAK